MENQRHYCAGDCGDEKHTCTAWDGKGTNLSSECYVDENGQNNTRTIPNHNLVEKCPPVNKCEYRMPKRPSIAKK